MEFEWDEEKRKTNLLKHDLDFRDADLIFDGPHLVENARSQSGEPRWRPLD